MADAKANGAEGDNRPLSPHLQVYRFELTMIASFAHRATGVALYGGVIVLAWWLIAAASGAAAYDQFQMLAGGFFGRLVLFGFTAALSYHLLNGIRHLFWDVGRGFEPGTATMSAWFVVLGTIVSTFLVWAAGYGLIGG